MTKIGRIFVYPYGLIGNSQASALVDENGTINWLCLPRPDSPPVFGRLLDENGGHFAIEGVGAYKGRQSYVPNTNVLETILSDSQGHAFKITDFCPRFYQHGRMYRPLALFRIVEPLSGSPTIRVKCRPVSGWEKTLAKAVRGNSHLRFEIRGEQLRLWTNMPLTYLCGESEFVLKEPTYFGLTWSFGIQEDLVAVSKRFLSETKSYWESWVKHCSIPSLYQRETIRSALALKLHCYEDTGAILAGLTTSLPEEVGHSRNWDYRFCWLRDSYYVLSAFHNLGHFEEMEGFITFLLNLAERHDPSQERLRPVYRLDQTLPLPEQEHSNWSGFSGSRPVRSDNQAAEHVQNDVYGEMILTLAPIFLDERFRHLRTAEHEKLLAHLGRLCVQNVGQGDAGLWELRNGWQEHSFSNLMCWAGIDRIMKIQMAGHLAKFDINFDEARARAEQAVRRAVKEGALRNGPIDESFDAALLQIANLRFPDEDLCRNTVLKIKDELAMSIKGQRTGFLFRYIRSDDFGRPKSAFLICSFWLVQALAKIGERDMAREVLAETMTSANELGLFSEHYFPEERLQAGNFPQAYSHVGQINAAFAVSPPWNDIL